MIEVDASAARADVDLDPNLVTLVASERALLRGVPRGGDSDEAAPPRVPVDVVALPMFADERPLTGLAGLIDWRSSGRLSAVLRSGWFIGSEGEAVLMPGRRVIGGARIMLFGLGPAQAAESGAAGERAFRCGRGLASALFALRPADVLVGLSARPGTRAQIEDLFAGLVSGLSAEHATATRGGADGDSAERSAQRVPAPAVWVAVDDSQIPRLRRVLVGPPRAARG